jgi:hypothetical protein
MAFAAALWGTRWSRESTGGPTLVVCWSDNAAAVAWNNAKASRNAHGQEINRAIGLREAVDGFRMTARHLPGESNVMADAGSRAWTEPFGRTWTNLSVGWTQVAVPTETRKIYSTFSNSCSPQLWPSRRDGSTMLHGENGGSGRPTEVSQASCHVTRNATPSSSRSTRPAVGEAETAPPPCCPKSATSRGIIKQPSGTASASTPDTDKLCGGCRGCRQRREANDQPPSPSSLPCEPTATSASPKTAFYGGLRSWASSSSCENRST